MRPANQRVLSPTDVLQVFLETSSGDENCADESGNDTSSNESGNEMSIDGSGDEASAEEGEREMSPDESSDDMDDGEMTGRNSQSSTPHPYTAADFDSYMGPDQYAAVRK